VEGPGGKILFGRPSHKYEDNIEMHLQVAEWASWT